MTPEKIFYPVLVLLAVAAVGWGASAAGGHGAAFGLFASFVIGGSLACVWERSIVRSAFCLLGTFGGTAGLFLLLGADFLAVAQILIYVGGILALILFGVMLSPPDLEERQLPRVLTAFVGIGAGVAWIAAKVASSVAWYQTETLPEPESSAAAIGVGFLASDEYVVAFELAAIVLTVALVAAVYIARRRAGDLEERGAA